jgi:3-deoxy-D-manno-octulosonic-acid transferase
MGNLKFDIEPPLSMLNLGREIRVIFGQTRKILVAASTREGEEALLLDALQSTSIRDLLLVIIPRHPQRFTDVAKLLELRSIPFVRRSDLNQIGKPNNGDLPCQAVPPEVQVVLGDSMGEMFAYYAAADLAFIGGSLLPYGGQNLIEACVVGTPVLVGPHMYNFAEATRWAVSARAAIQVTDVAGLVTESQRLFTDAIALNDMRQKCAGFVEYNRGATEMSLQLVRQHLG